MLHAQERFSLDLSKQITLPSNAIYDIMEDHNGYIWMTGNTGLLKYDATKFINYRCDAQSALSGSCLKQDKYNRIWYENFDGYLYYVENEILKPLQQKNVLNFVPFGIIGNNLITVQKNGFDIYDLKTLAFSKTINYNIPQNVSTASNNKNLYLLIDNEFMLLNSDLKVKKCNYFLKNTELLKHVSATEDYVFVYGRNNVNEIIYIFDNQLNFIKTVSIKGPKIIQNISFIDQKIWVNSPSGSYILDINQPNDTLEILLKNTSVSKVIKDRYNNYWISSTSKGITILPQNIYTFYNTPSKENNKFIAAENGFYIATTQGLLYNFDLINQNTTKIYQTENEAEIYYLTKDKNTKNIFLSANGFTKITAKQKVTKAQFAVKKMIQIDSNTMAFASSGLVALYLIDSEDPNSSNILSKLKNHTSINFQKNTFEIDGNIRAKTIAYSLAENAIYYSGNKGFFSFSTLDFSKLQIKHNNQAFYATEIAVGVKYKYILNTKGNIYRLDKNNHFTLINHLFNCNENEVTFFKESNGYGLVVAQNKFYLLNLKNDKIKLVQLPLLTSEIKDVLLTDKTLYLLLLDGVLKTNLGSNDTSQNNFPFYISRVEVNNKAVKFKGNLELDYYKNNITVSCAYLNYVFFNSQSIYYSLNNQSWQVLNPKDKNIQFAALKPGKYDLKFKIDEKILGEKLTFSIANPFWLSWWFISLCISLIILAAFFYNGWRTALHAKQIKLLEEKVVLEQRLGKSILTSIKSQMNPHFFYNALNTIQAYIFTNDKKKASVYLGKFSKLTRMILEMSEKESIPIQNEIEGLRLYLELEKMRFEDNFNFAITILPSLDSEMIKIPSMLVQPYAENAVKHGLMHSKGEKNLEITFDRIENDLIVKIIDNGIGLENAALLKSKNDLNHQSFSNNANQKRLEILNQNRTQKLSLKFDVLDTHNPEQPGTIVTLTIPIN